MRPVNWHDYNAAVAERRVAPSADMNRFAARYNAATTLQTIGFRGMSPATNEGYLHAMRLGMSYAALEALERAIHGRIGGVRISSAAIADEYRDKRAAKFVALLLDETTHPRLTSRLQAVLIDKSSDDVRAIAQATRHLMFHGVLTPGGSGLDRSVHVRTATSNLSRAVLETADVEFGTWLAASSQGRA